MGMKRSPQDIWRQIKAARDEEDRYRASDRVLWRNEALFHIALFNHRLETHLPVLAWPTIGALRLVDHCRVDVMCEACSQVSIVDLRRITCDDDAGLNWLLPKLRCERCKPHSTRVRIVGVGPTVDQL